MFSSIHAKKKGREMMTIQIKQPSKQLKQRIKTFVRTTVKNAIDEYDSIIKDATLEGFTEKEAYKMVYDELLKTGYSRTTIWRMLPSSGRGKPRGKPKESQPVLFQNETKPESTRL